MIERVTDLQETNGIRPGSDFDYGQIDEGIRDEVKQAARAIRQLEQGVITGILAIGKRLIEVKGMIPHGQFAAWVMGEFGMEERTAQRMMSVAKEYSDPQKRQTLSLFSPSVAYMLAAPSTPEEARAEIEQAATQGQKVTVEDAKVAIAAHKPTAAQVQKAVAQFAKPKPFESSEEIKSLREPVPGRAVYTKPSPKPSSIDAINRDLDAYDAAAEREIADYSLTARDQEREDLIAAGQAWTPEQETEADLTPLDLVAAGYRIVAPRDESTEWTWVNSDGNYEDMFGRNGYATLAVAIAEARRDASKTHPKRPHTDYYPVKHGLAVMPADLIAAGYSLENGDGSTEEEVGIHGYRWRFGEEVGPDVAYGGVAIEGARAHLEAYGKVSAPTPAPSTTPDDLAAAGYAIVPSQDGKGWRWKWPTGEASAVYGPPYDAIDDAIMHTREMLDIGKDKAAAAPVPAPEPKTLSALFPDDDELRRAKFVLHETDQGWRYAHITIEGQEYGPMRATKEDAIADAKWALAQTPPPPVITAGFVDTGKGKRKLKPAELEMINATVEAPAVEPEQVAVDAPFIASKCQYRKRPIIVEAEQFLLGQEPYPAGVEVVWVDQYQDGLVLCAYNQEPPCPGNVAFGLRAHNGWFVVWHGDWIITDANGKRWVCEGKEFENLYEQVSDGPQTSL